MVSTLMNDCRATLKRLTACNDIMALCHVPHEGHLKWIVSMRKRLRPDETFDDVSVCRATELTGQWPYDITGMEVSGSDM